MEQIDQHELSDIQKKLDDIQKALRERGQGENHEEKTWELVEKVTAIEDKLEELSKRQASMHKILTVLQQQISGLKVGISTLEDFWEKQEPESKQKRVNRYAPHRSSSKAGKIIAGIVVLALIFFFLNRWITGYLDSRWDEHAEAVPGIYESLETPQTDQSPITTETMPYEQEIQTQIGKKLDEIVPKDDDSKVTDHILPDIFVPKVLILNGCGVSGIAEKLATYLRQNGIHVVDSKNADNFNYPSTIIFSTSDNPDDHIWLEFIGVNPKTVKPLQEERENANTVIILGKDYKNLSVF
ncbi:MAG: LytR C-terminal domain-containing protein [Candidatus Marinimicrobia bacterium]|nr:LytR C-terminal domain-containing protein [Candidatus Neomarinimicrobiota bacterium]